MGSSQGENTMYKPSEERSLENMAYQNKTVKAHNDWNKVVKKITPLQKDFLAVLISKMTEEGQKENFETGTFSISKDEILKTMCWSNEFIRKNWYKEKFATFMNEFSEAISGLSIYEEYETADTKKKRERRIYLFSSFDWQSEEDSRTPALTFKVNTDAIRYFSNFENGCFYKYKLADFYKIRGKHPKELFGFCQQYKKLGKFYLSKSDVIEVFNLQSYDTRHITTLMKDCVKALKEIFPELRVVLRKQGRETIGYDFYFKKQKESDEQAIEVNPIVKTRPAIEDKNPVPTPEEMKTINKLKPDNTIKVKTVNVDDVIEMFYTIYKGWENSIVLQKEFLERFFDLLYPEDEIKLFNTKLVDSFEELFIQRPEELKEILQRKINFSRHQQKNVYEDKFNELENLYKKAIESSDLSKLKTSDLEVKKIKSFEDDDMKNVPW